MANPDDDVTGGSSGGSIFNPGGYLSQFTSEGALKKISALLKKYPNLIQLDETGWIDPKTGRVYVLETKDGELALRQLPITDSRNYVDAVTGASSGGGGGGGGGGGSDPAYLALQQAGLAEDTRQFDISTAEGRRQFDLEYQRQIKADAESLGFSYDQLNQQEKDSVRNLSYQYYNSTLDANAARQQALATLIQSKQNAATDIAQTSGNFASQAAQFAAKPYDAGADALFRTAIGGQTPYGELGNQPFNALGTQLGDKFTELFGGVGQDLARAREYLNQPIPDQYTQPIVAPQVPQAQTYAPQVQPYDAVSAAYARDPNAAQTFFSQKPEDLARFFGGSSNPTAAALTGLQSQAPKDGYTQEQIAALMKIASGQVPGFAKGGEVAVDPNAPWEEEDIGKTRRVTHNPTTSISPKFSATPGQAWDPIDRIQKAYAGEALPGTSVGPSTSTRGIVPSGGDVQYQIHPVTGAVQIVANPVNAPGLTLNQAPGAGMPGQVRPITPQEAQALAAKAFSDKVAEQTARVRVAGNASPEQVAGAQAGAKRLIEANLTGTDFLTGGAKGGRTSAEQAGLRLLNIDTDALREQFQANMQNPAVIAALQRAQQNNPNITRNPTIAAALAGRPLGGAGNIPQVSQPITPEQQQQLGGEQVLSPQIIPRFAGGGSVSGGVDFESIFGERDKPGYSPASSEGGTNLNIHERAIILGESGQVYGTLGEKRPDGSIRAENLVIKPLKSEVEKDKQMAEQGKQAVESQKKTMAAFAQGGTATAGAGTDLLTKIRALLQGLDPQITAPEGQLLPDPRLLGGQLGRFQQDTDLYDLVKSGYGSMGISDPTLDYTIKQYRPGGYEHYGTTYR